MRQNPQSSTRHETQRIGFYAFVTRGHFQADVKKSTIGFNDADVKNDLASPT